jgi:N-methylhydantoinase A
LSVAPARRAQRVGVDTGGTFTDLVVADGPTLRVVKCLSTPRDPARAVLAALAEGEIPRGRQVTVVHGTTVATNTLLTRTGARTALVTTEGFEDVVALGRQARPALYDLFQAAPEPLVPAALRFGVRTRTRADGRLETPPAAADVRRLVAALRRARPASIALCLLFSYANPAAERRLARALGALGVPLSVSSRLLPEYREYERTSTTCVNAYVLPRMSRYLEGLDRALGRRLRVMQSSGGSLSARAAGGEPVRTVLSGPAGGVVGAQAVAARAGFRKIITFDMGGTSTDVCLVDGTVPTTAEAAVAGCPIRVPVIDIHTVGAGGGSIAWVDAGGLLRVGPQSAGADPGPACYGRGRALTVTDANLHLGRLHAGTPLAGRLHLRDDRVRTPLAALARKLGLTPARAAEGVAAIANATMEKALRVISMERGHDPREFALVAFGGAGPMHAADLARVLRIPTVIVPRMAGALSALGLLFADVTKDSSHTLLMRADRDGWTAARAAFAALEEAARRAMRAEGVPPGDLVLARSLDLRYAGQSYELNVPASWDHVARFHRLHAQRYGHADRARAVELVHVRLRAIGKARRPPLPPPSRTAQGGAREALVGKQAMIFEGKPRAGRILDREGLAPGAVFRGPAIVLEASATTVVPPDFRARIDDRGNLLLTLS